MLYTGEPCDVCPITLKPVKELDFPVCFAGQSSQAYECEDVIQWLKLCNGTNPITGMALCDRRIDVILQPLQFDDDDRESGDVEERVRLTRSMLRSAGYALPVKTYDLRWIALTFVLEFAYLLCDAFLFVSWRLSVNLIAWLVASFLLVKLYPVSGKFIVAADFLSTSIPIGLFCYYEENESLIILMIKLRSTAMFFMLMLFQLSNLLFNFSVR